MMLEMFDQNTRPTHVFIFHLICHDILCVLTVDSLAEDVSKSMACDGIEYPTRVIQNINNSLRYCLPSVGFPVAINKNLTLHVLTSN